MKHYCLKSEAKSKLLEQAVEILAAIVFVLFLGGLVWLPASFFIAPDITAELILCHIGIFSWTAVLSFIAIVIKRWLQSNIVEC